ncbi:MAG: hypothetical protein WA989_16775 [Henriciella sp.]|uniref:hypothetical protein n=1 Tax=Henriciella sp. TaxID=1968823 RepID=UPI003C72D06F
MMKRLICAGGIALLATACISPEDRLTYKDGAMVTRGEIVQAFSDAVISHCLIAMHTGKEFKEFEVKGVTPIRALAENKISLFGTESPQVWQMVEAMVQVQYTPGESCEVRAVSAPVEPTLNVVGRSVLQSDYRYSEEDTGFPQDSVSMKRVLVAGAGGEAYTVYLSGTEPGVEGNPETYAKLKARVVKGAQAS